MYINFQWDFIVERQNENAHMTQFWVLYIDEHRDDNWSFQELATLSRLYLVLHVPAADLQIHVRAQG